MQATQRPSSHGLIRVPLLGVVFEQLVDQINVGHEHSTTTISLQPKGIHRRAIIDAGTDDFEVLFVEIGYNLDPQSAIAPMLVEGGLALPQEKQRMGMIIVISTRESGGKKGQDTSLEVSE